MQGILERRGGVALYSQVRARVEALIHERGLQPGAALPAESELQRIFGVSRATVRQALSELERAGVIERRQGKGTFVALPCIERPIAELTSFSEHIEARGMRAGSRLVSFAWIDAESDSDAQHFASPAKLARVVRVRLANDVPVGLHTLYVPAEIAVGAQFTPERLAADPGISFYRTLEAAGIRIAQAEEHLSARRATAFESRCLGIKWGAPIMSVLRLTRDQLDRLVEVVRAAYVADRFDYVVNLQRRAAQGAGPMSVSWHRGGL